MTPIDLNELERIGNMILIWPDPAVRRGWFDMVVELRAARARIAELELEQSRLEMIACGRGYETGKPNEVPE